MAERRRTMKDLFKSLWADESGQGLTEYAVIVALVAVALILVLIAFRHELGRIFRAIVDELGTNVGSITQEAS
jgi:pilus assembly protein Flp/PilA